jgi:hypothetical protein
LQIFRQISFWYAVTHPIADGDPIRDRKRNEIPVGTAHFYLLNDKRFVQDLYGSFTPDVLAEKWKELWTLWLKRDMIEERDEDLEPHPPCSVISQECVECCVRCLGSGMDLSCKIEGFSSSPHDQAFIGKLCTSQRKLDRWSQGHMKEVMENLLRMLDENRKGDSLYSYVAFNGLGEPITSGFVKK